MSPRLPRHDRHRVSCEMRRSLERLRWRSRLGFSRFRVPGLHGISLAVLPAEGTMKIRRAAVLTAALILTLACRPNQSLEGQARDAKIATQIKTKLASQVSASTITSVSVNVTNGVVTLAGPVHSAQESSQIESVARGVEGVKDVKNALQVLAPETNVTPANAAPPPSR